ncbi:MAG: hypothetical protein HFI35_04275 [Roseburia sp.]|jgi:hypothetical protein|nr:hypothetical protein [Roseburia sp.]
MEKEKIGSESTNLIKIELNNFGDYITISPDNSTFFDKFVAGYKKIADMADEVPAKLEEVQKKYENRDDFEAAMDKALEMSGVNVDFSKEAVSVIDGIFGADTVKKYFRNIYEVIPDFLPDANCIIDFFEKIVPVVEKLFDCKVEREQKAGKARMAKYQPQNHKRPQRKTK